MKGLQFIPSCFTEDTEAQRSWVAFPKSHIAQDCRPSCLYCLLLLLAREELGVTSVCYGRWLHREAFTEVPGIWPAPEEFMDNVLFLYDRNGPEGPQSGHSHRSGWTTIYLSPTHSVSPSSKALIGNGHILCHLSSENKTKHTQCKMCKRRVWAEGEVGAFIERMSRKTS